MESKLQELIGQSNVWLYVTSSKGWIKNVEILDVDDNLVTFRYHHESDTETKVWEKTTRIDNIAEIDLRLVAVPKDKQHMENMRKRFTRMLENE